MSRIYVGNLPPRISERELEDEFGHYGTLRSVWVARKMPGFAFVEFEDRRDAQDAIRGLDGKNGWRVELSRSSGGGPRGRGEDMKCYECGEPGHFARECRLRIGSGGQGTGGRGRSRSPLSRYRSSPHYERRYSRSPVRRGSPIRKSSPLPKGSPVRRSISPRRVRSPLPRGSPVGRSISPRRERSPLPRGSPLRRSISPRRERSPPRRSRNYSPASNGNSRPRGRQDSRSRSP